MYDDYKINLLYIMLPKTSIYVKCYDGQTKWMYFFIENNDLLEKHNTICNTVSSAIKKEFGNKPVYIKKYLKTKINLTVMKLQVFIINKFLKWALIIFI